MVAGKLVIVPCSEVSVADLLARQELTRVMTAVYVDRYRYFWIQWYNKRKVTADLVCSLRISTFIRFIRYILEP